MRRLPGKWTECGLYCGRRPAIVAHFGHTSAANTSIYQFLEWLPLIGKSVTTSPEFPTLARPSPTERILSASPVPPLKLRAIALPASQLSDFQGELDSSKLIPNIRGIFHSSLQRLSQASALAVRRLNPTTYWYTTPQAIRIIRNGQSTQACKITAKARRKCDDTYDDNDDSFETNTDKMG